MSESAIRVLIVDDAEDVRRALRRLLERRGFAVNDAETAEQACLILAESKVDVVLLDLNLAGISGKTVYHTFIGRWPYLEGRIIIVSGNLISDESASWAEACGVPALAKPFITDELVQLITEHGRPNDHPHVRNASG